MYKKKTYIYGNRIEILKYHTSRLRVKGERRRKKEVPTEESVKRANEKNSMMKLYRLIMCNFIPGEDMFLTLTYKPEERPDEEGAKKILAQFLRKMRKEYERAGSELKYICVTEWEGKSIHHHIVINNCEGFNKIISKCWTYGGRRFEPLYEDYDFLGLAEYMIKETSKTFREKDCPFRKRYTPSRNLKKPVEIVEVIKASEWKEEPVVPKKLMAAGYVLDRTSVVVGTDIFGFPYQTYTMVKRC